ncbi:hypothetical protein CLU79DRAFT_564669 [Phycomyces nitens]|nr:hypothetical protein CLU79DRAFT_564669 [Phycomyces nitens]
MMEDDELDFENFDYGDMGDFNIDDFDVEAMDKELGLESPLPTKLEIPKTTTSLPTPTPTNPPISSTPDPAAASATPTEPTKPKEPSKPVLDTNKKEDGEVENTNQKSRPSIREPNSRPNRPTTTTTMSPMARNNNQPSIHQQQQQHRMPNMFMNNPGFGMMGMNMMPMNPYGMPMMNYPARPPHRIHVNPKFAGAIPIQSTIPLHTEPHRMQRERELDEQRKRLMESQRKRQNERQQFPQEPQGQ